MSKLRQIVGLCLVVLGLTPHLVWATNQPTSELTDYFPPPEEQSGWRTLLPVEGEPDDSQRAQIRSVGGMDWDALKMAWAHNAAAAGRAGLLVMRRGYVVGEWYKWWTASHISGAPNDLVMTLGRHHNDGFVVPSLDLLFVRLGDGERFPKDFERDLFLEVLAAVVK